MTTPAPEVPPEMRLYRVTDVARLLSLSRSTLYILMESGRLRSVKEGRTRLIPGTAIVEYIARLEQEGRR
ncbi:excisionase [Actinomadura sp. NBRC 104425]|uniref:helix-turn-helix domain-containing protein n=1 Tax=Actinomadura sp. NBRC 104425 TaxID=3032204 RepID=UPI0024A5D15A|nr:helix-turn-helix domain-containing protein [Actinomadura sp. NBRC 104425]GLZ15859.1 excisionase [Actinomadura sp. NBRC 104425]